MRITALTGVLGAAVTDVDLATTMDDATIATLRDAIVAHKVVVFPDQHLSPDLQVALSRRFGPFGPVPFIEPLAGHPEVIRVVKEADEGAAFNFGGAWHTDFSFQPEPPWLTFLYAVDIPPHGGDTVWADLAAAYRALGPAEAARLQGLRAVHTARDAYSPKMQALHDGLAHMDIHCVEEANDEQEHPLICAHPESGEPVLWFNNTYVRGVRGPGIVAAEEADALQRWLYQHTTDIRFTFRHRWRPGDLVVWDNRCTQHIALNDYAGFRRELHRTTVGGPPPNAAPTP